MSEHRDLTALSDQTLVALVLTGDANRPWEELDRRYRPRAVTTAHAIVRHVWPERTDEGADIAQEALFAAYRALGRYDGRPFWPWLATIVRSRAIDRLRRLRLRKKDRFRICLLGDHDQAVRDPAVPPPEQLAREEEVRHARRKLRRGLRELTHRERQVLLHFHTGRKAVPQLAAEHRLAEQTIRGLLSRAKKKLLAGLGGIRLCNRELAELLVG
jgi:RNA polymerase sigma factor (sigma-70 family)